MGWYYRHWIGWIGRCPLRCIGIEGAKMKSWCTWGRTFTREDVYLKAPHWSICYPILRVRERILGRYRLVGKNWTEAPNACLAFIRLGTFLKHRFGDSWRWDTYLAYYNALARCASCSLQWYFWQWELMKFSFWRWVAFMSYRSNVLVWIYLKN